MKSSKDNGFWATQPGRPKNEIETDSIPFFIKTSVYLLHAIDIHELHLSIQTFSCTYDVLRSLSIRVELQRGILELFNAGALGMKLVLFQDDIVQSRRLSLYWSKTTYDSDANDRNSSGAEI